MSLISTPRQACSQPASKLENRHKLQVFCLLFVEKKRYEDNHTKILAHNSLAFFATRSKGEQIPLFLSAEEYTACRQTTRQVILP